MMNFAVAQSYFIDQSNDPNNNIKIDIPEKSFEKLIGNFLISFFNIKQIGIVSAEVNAEINDEIVCCPKLLNGEICQEITLSKKNICETSIIPTICENVDDCRLGCCIDESTGEPSKNSPQLTCTSQGGKWFDDPMCNIDEAIKGCCVLEEKGYSELLNKKRCEILSLKEGVEVDFRNGFLEPECIDLLKSEQRGACIIDNMCSITYKDSCNGRFEEGFLCSHEKIGLCKPQETISCASENERNSLHGIYWFDSCGNRENIYDSDKTKSFNDGKILEEIQSCNDGNGNINSKTCGNCHVNAESICSFKKDGVKDGDYVCKDLGCYDTNNAVLKDFNDMYGYYPANGESWCIYEFPIIDTQSTVGSEHWRASCANGIVNIETAGEHREKICAQSMAERPDGSKFVEATNLVNDWSSCLSYNEEDDMVEKCEKNRFCTLNHVNVDVAFAFSTCVPKYPIGLDLKGDIESDIVKNEELCSMANRQCIIKQKRDNIHGDWGFKENEGCTRWEFIEEMNDLCTSMGDCGTYINYKGEGTDNIDVWGSDGSVGGLILGHLSRFHSDLYSGRVKNLAIPRGTNKEKYITLNGANEDLFEVLGFGKDYKDFSQKEVLAYTSGAVGALGMLSTGSVTYLGTSAGFAGFGVAAIGAGIGMGLSLMLNNLLDMENEGAIIAIIGMTTAGLGFGMLAGNLLGSMGAIAASNAWNPVGWAFAIAGTITAILAYTIKWGQTRELTMNFECYPWQPPEGKQDCNACDDDPKFPCNKYKCESIGLNCVLLGDDELENPTCEYVPLENKAPIISPGNIDTEGYVFKETENGVDVINTMREDGRIQEYTPVKFTLKTDEYTMCRFDTDNSATDFDAMDQTLGQHGYRKEHYIEFNMPPINVLGLAEKEVTELMETYYANFKLYVRCKDYNGNPSGGSYIVGAKINSGPDEKAVSHTSTKFNPESKSFLEYDVETLEMTMWTNEPATCKYSNESGVDYENMLGEMSCNTNFMTDYNKNNGGWPCSTTLNNLNLEENKIYIKCKDNSDNVNKDDYEYILYTSNSELTIESIKLEVFNGDDKVLSDNGYDFEIGGLLRYIDVLSIVKTSGGAKNGESICWWGDDYKIKFLDKEGREDKTTNTQMLSNKRQGNYNFPIKCIDDAGNFVEDVIKFEIVSDSTAPEIIRVYSSGNQLTFVTDETSQCFYNTSKWTDFNIQSSTVFSKTHNIQTESDETYYIKCKDVWGKSNDGEYAIIVKQSPD